MLYYYYIITLKMMQNYYLLLITQDYCEIYYTIFSHVTGYNDSKEVATLQRQDIKIHKVV